MQQVDAKAGVAHVELLQQDQDQTAEDNAEGQEVDAATADAPAEGQKSAPADADGSRVFFLLKVQLIACSEDRVLILSIFWFSHVEECKQRIVTRWER